MRVLEDLFPLCRSITGDGLRRTLEYISERSGARIVEVPSGTKVFDWEIPLEWTIRDAWIKDSSGERVVDFQKSNLHVVNYSEPVSGSFTLEELRTRLHTIPERPDSIPYVTSYYNRTWGFCLAHSVLQGLEEGEYEVLVDSELKPGSLSYAELLIPGSTDEEFLISCHSCHPSLANDNLSGIAVALRLAQTLSESSNRYSYRFVFAPGTIGAIAWLARNENGLEKIAGGLTLANLGDAGHFNYKRSRQSNSLVDRVVASVLNSSEFRYGIRDFEPYGYDERQYCSPGVDLAVGSLTRSVFGTFKEYHTSDDNLTFVSEDRLQESLSVLKKIVYLLENNTTFRNLNPMCEPQLGRRGLYSAMGGYVEKDELKMALLWVLNLSDGEHSLLDISESSAVRFDIIVKAAALLVEADLLEEVVVNE